MKTRQPATNNFLLYWILALVLAFAITSCSTSRKTQQHQKQTHDSTKVETKITEAKAKTDSAGSKSTKTITDGSTTIELDNYDNYWFLKDTAKTDNIEPADYEPVKRNTIILPGGGKIITNQPIKSITTAGTTEATTNENAELRKEQSSGSSETAATTVSNTSESGSSSKKQTNWRALIGAGIVLFIIIILFRQISKHNS